MRAKPVFTDDSPPPIRKSIYLPYCWVCKKVFVEHGGLDNSVLEHVHHVVPQAAGGKDGPTVSLCTHHHDLLHRIAEAWTAQSNQYTWLKVGAGATLLNSIGDKNHKIRLRYLAHIVARSLREVKTDPNKRVTVTLSLSAQDNQMLLDLQALTKQSKPATLISLLRAAHARTFVVR